MKSDKSKNAANRPGHLGTITDCILKKHPYIMETLPVYFASTSSIINLKWRQNYGLSRNPRIPSMNKKIHSFPRKLAEDEVVVVAAAAVFSPRTLLNSSSGIQS